MSRGGGPDRVSALEGTIDADSAATGYGSRPAPRGGLLADALHPAWHLALDALRDGVALVGCDDRLISCNEPFRVLSGLVGTPSDARLGELLPWLRPALAGRSEPVQVQGRWLEANVQPLGGSEDHRVVLLLDVTRQRTSEERLRESTEVLEAVFAQAPVAILTIDESMRVVTWNPAAEALFGWSADEIRGQSYLWVVPPAEREAFGALYTRVVSGEGFTGVEVERVRKDGSPVIVGVSTAPIRDGRGAVIGVMAILEDRTARRQLEDKVRQAERMEAIGRLAGGVAHDFNNLLTVILAATDMLEVATEKSRRERLLDDIRRGSERAAELTRQLLAFSRRQVLQPARLDLSDAVREAGSMVERVIGVDIDVSITLSPEPLPVVADRGQLARVVLNLAVNARDAMPAGGRMWLVTRPVPAERRPATLPEGEYVELSVSDSGSGVDPAVLPHIFEPFFTTKAPGVGTGLGLAMVYGVVQQSGGDVVVESSAAGATFRVVLPRAVGPIDVERPVELRPAVGGRSGATVLLVEDDDEVRATLQALLGALGYRVFSAANGREALQIADSHEGPIDVLVTDLVMPGMTGREVAEALVAWRPTTRVLYVSGYTDDEVLHQGVGGEGTAFLQKPFTAAALDGQLRRLLEG